MKKRQGNRFIAKEKDAYGNILCLIPNCKQRAAKGKNGRMRNYCSNHSFLHMREYTNWPTLRMKAIKRDNYTCVKCGKVPKVDNCRKGHKPEINTSALIGDHIIPIALGGDEFNINNVQTLCIKCNKEKTAQDIKDIAEARRFAKLKTRKLI